MSRSRKKRRLNHEKKCWSCAVKNKKCHIARDSSPGEKCTRCSRENLICVSIPQETVKPPAPPETDPEERLRALANMALVTSAANGYDQATTDVDTKPENVLTSSDHSTKRTTSSTVTFVKRTVFTPTPDSGGGGFKLINARDRTGSTPPAIRQEEQVSPRGAGCETTPVPSSKIRSSADDGSEDSVEGKAEPSGDDNGDDSTFDEKPVDEEDNDESGPKEGDKSLDDEDLISLGSSQHSSLSDPSDEDIMVVSSPKVGEESFAEEEIRVNTQDSTSSSDSDPSDGESRDGAKEVREASLEEGEIRADSQGSPSQADDQHPTMPTIPTNKKKKKKKKNKKKNKDRLSKDEQEVVELVEAMRPDPDMKPWIRRAYILQYMKRLRSCVKDFDAQYRLILDEFGPDDEITAPVAEKNHKAAKNGKAKAQPAKSKTAVTVQTPLDALDRDIHWYEARCLEGIPKRRAERQAGDQDRGTKLTDKPYLSALLSNSLFFTHRLDASDHLLNHADLKGYRDKLRDFIWNLKLAGQWEAAMQLQECVLLTYSEEYALASEAHAVGGPFSGECQVELKTYQTIQQRIFEGFKGDLRRPVDHLPLVEHSDELLRMAISCRMFYESEDILGRSLVQIAIANKRVDIGNLVAKSIRRYGHDDWGMSPLHVACMVGNAHAVRVLLQVGVEIFDRVGKDWWLPWHFAAYSGNLDVVILMLEAMVANGGDVMINAQTGGKQTAIAIAARYGHQNVVQFLLDNHADPLIVDKRHRSALHRAILWRSFDVAAYLIDQMGSAIIPPEDDPDYNALHVMCYEEIKGGHDPEDDKVMLDLLLAQRHLDLDVNERDDHGETALHLAVSRGIEAAHIVQMLLDCPQLDKNLKDKDGKTPLHLAVERGDYEMVKLLLDCDQVNYFAVDGTRQTAWALADKLGFVGIKGLLENKPGVREMIPSRKRKRQYQGDEWFIPLGDSSSSSTTGSDTSSSDTSGSDNSIRSAPVLPAPGTGRVVTVSSTGSPIPVAKRVHYKTPIAEFREYSPVPKGFGTLQ